ncbi:hypothetical protein Tco_0146563 [Tanacetum coccineum]
MGCSGYAYIKASGLVALVAGADPECDVTLVEKDVAQRQPEKAKRKKLLKRSDPLPAKRPHFTIRGFFSADVPNQCHRVKALALPRFGQYVGGSSQPETSEESTDSFYETAVLNSEDDQALEFNVGAARQICLGSEVRSRAEHELELKEKLRGKYDARGVSLRDKVAEGLLRLKSLRKEKEMRRRGVREKDTDISLLDSRASYLKSALDDSQAACDEARSLISSLSSERDGLASEMKMDALEQEEQASGSCIIVWLADPWDGACYWFNCLKSPKKYKEFWVIALGRATVDYGMQRGLAVGMHHGFAWNPLSAFVAYDPETAKNNYFDAVRGLEEADFPLIPLLKSKKDSGMG